LKKVVSQAD